MKQLLFLMFLALNIFFANAQKSQVSSAANFLTSGKLDKAKEAIDKGIGHEKCVNWPKAYLIKGKVYQGIFESPLQAFKKLSDKPLEVALKSYKKTLELDLKNKYTKQVKLNMTNLVSDFINLGVENYNNGGYEQALVAFERALEIENMDMFKESNVVDTAVIWNAALAAQKAENFPKAVKYYQESLKFDYNASKSYAGLYKSLKKSGQEEKAIEYLHKGFELFPNDQSMLIELINHYLLGGEPEKANEYLDRAIALDPNNGSLYSAKGSLFEKTKEFDRAVPMFEKAIELNPKDYTSAFNLALMKYNLALEHHKRANEIMDAKAYNEEFAKVLEDYKSVLPYFEKVLEIKPDEKNSIIALKELYFKLRSENEEYMQKYNEMKSKLELLN